MMNDQPAPREILDALLGFQDAAMKKFEEHDRRFDRLEDRMVRGFDSVDLRFDALERRIGALELRA